MDSLSAKSSQTQSLLEFLLQENPILNGSRVPGGNNTKSLKLTYSSPQCIQEWEDFKIEALSTCNGGVFQQALLEKHHFHDHGGIPLYPFREVHDEDSLQCFLVKWNHSVVSDALEISQSSLHDQTSY